MITVQEATQIILSNTMPLKAESIPLHDATGRILQENLTTDRDMPPFDRVTMDGIAIDYAAFKNGQRSFKIESIGAAGAPQTTLYDPKNCIEIMTGAMLPLQADTVIRYEDVEIENGVATIQIDNIRHRQNVHFQGIDRKKHTIVATSGVRISPAEIGVAASVGKANLLVSALPKVQIISTGDELIEVSETPLPYQIRTSNVYTIQAALEQWGIGADRLHLLDDKAQLRTKLAESIRDYDVLILSGGVSKGKFDFIPEILDELGVKKHFHRIRQRPGKPFWFGRTADTFVFALPGNPVSSFMCLHRYFRTWLEASLDTKPVPKPRFALAAPVHFKPDLTYFVQVKLQYSPDDSRDRACPVLTVAMPIEGNGSGDFANLVNADGFLELERGKEVYEAGEVYDFLGWRMT